MRYILGVRGSGKTTELIKLSAEYGYYIAAPNRNAVRRLREQADNMGLRIPTPITYDTLLNGFGRGSLIAGVLIDDVDLFLMSLVPHLPIVGVTSTPDGLKVLDNPTDENLLDNLRYGYANEMDDV